MFKRFAKLIIALGILGALLYLVSVNRNPVSFTIFGSWKLEEYSMGVVAIILFFAGVLVASIFGLIIATPAYLRDRAVRAQLKNSLSLHERVAEARNATISHQWAKARGLWEALTKKDPSHLLASIELAYVLYKMGEPRSALRELTALKVENPANSEILYRSAEIHEDLGNKTAALDNLVQILTTNPSPYIAERATRLALETGNYTDALEYLGILEGFGGGETELGAKVRLASLTSELAESPVDERITQLKRFAKKNPSLVDSHLEIAQLEADRGNRKEACSVLLTAFLECSSLDSLHRLVGLCRAGNSLAEAVPFLKEGISGAPSRGGSFFSSKPSTIIPPNIRVEAMQLLIQVLVELGNYPEAAMYLRELKNETSHIEELAPTLERATTNGWVNVRQNISLIDGIIALEEKDQERAKSAMRTALIG